MRHPVPGQRTQQGRSDEIAALCRQALAPIGVHGASVTLVSRHGHRVTVHASDDVAQQLEEAQFALGEGPSVDAAGAGSLVLVDDVSQRSHGVQERWPAFLGVAGAAGVCAVFAFPLRIGAVRFGALGLHRKTSGPLDAGRLRAALLIADALALLVLDLSTAGGVDLGGDGAPAARLHAVVHGAAGMVKVQLSTTIEDALAQLRAVAFAQGRPIDDVASDVVTGRLRFPQEDA